MLNAMRCCIGWCKEQRTSLQHTTAQQVGSTAATNKVCDSRNCFYSAAYIYLRPFITKIIHRGSAHESKEVSGPKIAL